MERIGTPLISAMVGEMNGEPMELHEPMGLIGERGVQVTNENFMSATIAWAVEYEEFGNPVNGYMLPISIGMLEEAAQKYPGLFDFIGFRGGIDLGKESVVVVKYFGKTCYSSIIVGT